MDQARWKLLSPLLDQLLEMDAPARRRRLQHLHATDPALADELQRLLAQERDSDDFLAEPLWSPPPADPRHDTLVGPYRLVRLLGEGGMGQVWLAERADGLYRRPVALKLLRAGYADPNLRLRFSRERDILTRLEHPNLAQLLDAGVDTHGQPFLALAYVEGEPITDYCQRLQLPVEARVKLILQVCRAVSHAHANLVVHRDLKPSNILVTADGQVRLLDFGIAKLLDSTDGMAVHPPTEARAFTLHYAAPEQVRGEPITTQADVYSLGVVLYEVLTDQKPYRLRRQSDAEWETAILDVDPPRPSQAVLRAAEAGLRDGASARRLARRLRGDLDNIVLKALHKPLAQRYASVEALAGDLLRHLQGRPVQARPQHLGYRMQKYVRRHRWGLGFGSAALLALAAVSGTAVWQKQQARQETARAQAMQDFVVGLFDQAGNVRQGSFDVRRLLEVGERRGATELAQQPLARAELQGVIARLRIGLGDYDHALGLLEHQRQVLDTLDDAPASLRLESATQHGRVLALLGQASHCVAVMQPMSGHAGMQQSALPQLAAAFHSQLGRCQRMVGDLQAARRWFEKALALRRGVLRDRIGEVENLTDLAMLEADAGNTARAIAGYEAALAQLQGEGGGSHPQLVQLRRNLGIAYRELGDVDRAGRELHQARIVAERLYGPQHPETLDVRRLQAGLRVGQGQLAAAAAELRDVHAQTLAALGSEHRQIGWSWHALGLLALEQGDAARAVEDMAQAVRIWRMPDSARLLPLGLYGLALAQQQAGAPEQARRALEEARQLRVAQLGENDVAVADIDHRIAQLLAAQGQARQAGELLADALALARRSRGESHPQLLAMRLSWGRNLGQLGQRVEALRELDALATAGNQALLEGRRLRWQARAYAAEIRCHGEPARARRELAGLQAELRTALPEGGAVPREVQQLLQDCGTARVATR